MVFDRHKNGTPIRLIGTTLNEVHFGDWHDVYCLLHHGCLQMQRFYRQRDALTSADAERGEATPEALPTRIEWTSAVVRIAR
jgi:hypothetical protein